MIPAIYSHSQSINAREPPRGSYNFEDAISHSFNEHLQSSSQQRLRGAATDLKHRRTAVIHHRCDYAQWGVEVAGQVIVTFRRADKTRERNAVAAVRRSAASGRRWLPSWNYFPSGIRKVSELSSSQHKNHLQEEASLSLQLNQWERLRTLTSALSDATNSAPTDSHSTWLRRHASPSEDTWFQWKMALRTPCWQVPIQRNLPP